MMSGTTVSTPRKNKSGNNVRFVTPTPSFATMPEPDSVHQAAPAPPAPFFGRAVLVTIRSKPQKPDTTMPGFDDLCLDLTRSASFQQALHIRPERALPFRGNDLPGVSPVFRSLSVCDPKLNGHPIRFRSRHFSLSPRGLRVGDCEFLNLPTPGEGVNLSTRADIDGRPAFVLEIVGTLCDALTGKVTWVMAGQVDVTDVVRNMTQMVVKRKEDEARAKEEKARLEREKREVANARRAKEELLTYPHKVVAYDNAKYFSDSSDDTDEEQASDPDSDSDESTTLSTPDTSPSRSSLGSLPNKQFVFRANTASNPYTLKVEPRQVLPPKILSVDEPEDENDDIWLALAREESLPNHPYSASPPRPIMANRKSSSSTHSASSPRNNLHNFSHLVSTLRCLHRDSFVLKRPSPAQSSTLSSLSEWVTAWSTPSLLDARKQLDAFAMLSKNHEQTMQTLEGALKREKEFRMEVRWGQKGDGERKWLYAVPMVRGAGESKAGVMGSGEKCWMCFVVGEEVGNLWAV